MHSIVKISLCTKCNFEQHEAKYKIKNDNTLFFIIYSMFRYIFQ